MIEITGLHLPSLGELRRGDIQCFGEFGASGRVRTMQIGSHVKDLHKLT